MKLDDNYWEKYLDELMCKITEAVNIKDIGVELQIELLDLYNTIGNKKLPLALRRQKAVLVEHYLGMIKDISNNKKR